MGCSPPSSLDRKVLTEKSALKDKGGKDAPSEDTEDKKKKGVFSKLKRGKSKPDKDKADKASGKASATPPSNPTPSSQTPTAKPKATIPVDRRPSEAPPTPGVAAKKTGTVEESLPMEELPERDEEENSIGASTFGQIGTVLTFFPTYDADADADETAANQGEGSYAEDVRLAPSPPLDCLSYFFRTVLRVLMRSPLNALPLG